MKNAFWDLKPQTREQTVAIQKEVDEIVVKVNKDTKESMARTKDYIERKVREKMNN